MAVVSLEAAEPADETRRCQVLIALGDARARAGDMVRARESFLVAAELAKSLGLPEEHGQAALGYGGRFIWQRAGGDPYLVSLLEDALAALPDGDSVPRAHLLARLAGALRDQPELEARAALSKESVEIARRMGDAGTLCLVLNARFAAIWGPDNAHERLELANEAVQLADDLGEKELLFAAHHAGRLRLRNSEISLRPTRSSM